MVISLFRTYEYEELRGVYDGQMDKRRQKHSAMYDIRVGGGLLGPGTSLCR